jgi:phage tail sheath protein FI
VEAAKLGASGTLPQAMDGIFDQIGAMVVVVRVAAGEGESEAEREAATLTNLLGGVDADTGQYLGVHAFLAARSAVKVTPRILIAPAFTHQRPVDPENPGSKLANPVLAELLGIAERLRAVIIADGPNTNDADAVSHREDWGSPRVYVVDPWVKVMKGNVIVSEPPSARVAGLIAKIDNDRGFWWSPSNNVINGILGTSRPVDFALGDPNARANYLNENEVATIIQEDGYRLWGNRTCSSDPLWAFLSVRRTADMVNESLLQAHLWAVDRNITKTYVEDVTEGVNAYLRHLTAQGAILGGRCWADPDLNTPASVQDGKIYFNFDFTSPYPSEHIVFRSHLVNDYIVEVFG